MGAGAAKWHEEETEARGRKLDRWRMNAERRASLKLVSWNVNNFAPKATDVDVLFAHEKIELLIVC